LSNLAEIEQKVKHGKKRPVSTRKSLKQRNNRPASRAKQLRPQRKRSVGAGQDGKNAELRGSVIRGFQHHVFAGCRVVEPFGLALFDPLLPQGVEEGLLFLDQFLKRQPNDCLGLFLGGKIGANVIGGIVFGQNNAQFIYSYRY